MDLLIIGQGITGTLTAFQKISEGVSIRVIDRGLKYSASAKIPTLLSPLEPIAPHSAKFGALKEEWKAKFKLIEKELGIQILYHKPTLHLFKTQAQKQAAETQLTAIDPTLLAHPVPENTLSDFIGENAGGYDIRNTSYINTPHFLRQARKYFIERGLLIESKFEKKDLTIDSDQIKWKSMDIDALIFCIGAKLKGSVYFDCEPRGDARYCVSTLETDFFHIMPNNPLTIENSPIDLSTLPRTHIIRCGDITIIPLKNGECYIQTAPRTPDATIEIIPPNTNPPITSSQSPKITALTSIW